MYLITAVSLISDNLNEEMFIDSYGANPINIFKKLCTNKSYNYYLYLKGELIEKIINE